MVLYLTGINTITYPKVTQLSLRKWSNGNQCLKSKGFFKLFAEGVEESL